MSAAKSLEFSLPGDWWSVDLRGSDADVSRRVRDLIERVVGRDDERADLRRQLRSLLQDTVADARTIRADQIHIARNLIGPISVPIGLAVGTPGVTVPAGSDPSTTAKTLLDLLPGLEREILDHTSLAVVRSVEREASAGDMPSASGRLMVNYWIALPTGRVTIFSCTSPLVTLEKELLVLFDAIVMSVRLRAAP